MKYSMQLNMYRYILENYYQLPVSKMIIASFHPTAESYFYHEVDDYQSEIKEMLNRKPIVSDYSFDDLST